MPRPAAHFASSEELFDAVRALAARLDSAGEVRAAADLRNGLAAVNGLTDGWAELLEALERLRGGTLDPRARAVLDPVRADVQRIVRRH